MEMYLFSVFTGAVDTAIVFLFFVALKGAGTRLHALKRGWIYVGSILVAMISSSPLPGVPFEIKLELLGKFSLAGIFGVYASSRK